MYYKVDPTSVEEPRGFVNFSTSDRVPRVSICKNAIDIYIFQQSVWF